MVSLRCVHAVRGLFKKIGYQGIDVSLGQVSIVENLSERRMCEIKDALLQHGFQLLEDKRNIIIQQIKTLIIDLVYHLEEPLVENMSIYLSQKMGYNYTYMANIFSGTLGITIEKFFICHKIERIKELITYDELSLTEIAFKMHYSSVAHLSHQFKKVTSLTPSHFKRLNENKRLVLDNLCH